MVQLFYLPSFTAFIYFSSFLLFVMYPFCSSCLLILFFYLFIHISYSVILPVLSLLFVITDIDFLCFYISFCLLVPT